MRITVRAMDRRAMNLKDLVVPIIVATLVGAFSSYLATVVTLERVETKIVYIEKDLIDFKQLVTLISENQKQLLVRGVWMENMEGWKSRTEQRIERLELALINSGTNRER